VLARSALLGAAATLVVGFAAAALVVDARGEPADAGAAPSVEQPIEQPPAAGAPTPSELRAQVTAAMAVRSVVEVPAIALAPDHTTPVPPTSGVASSSTSSTSSPMSSVRARERWPAGAFQRWQHADPTTCPRSGRAAIVDRAVQAAWLCDGGFVTREMPITSARSQPDPGTYEVYAKDLRASSNLTGQYSEMTHFVAFTRGKYQGARIAFHSVPTYRDGSWVQPLDSVGTPERFGDSSGCIRVLPDDAVAIWDFLSIGGNVTVIS
jgi:hypothetical protein